MAAVQLCRSRRPTVEHQAVMVRYALVEFHRICNRLYVRRERGRCTRLAQRCAGASGLGTSRDTSVMSFVKNHALAIMFAAGLSQAVALSQSPLPQTESSLSRNPDLVHDWANRLLANDPKVRATAEAALVQGARRSLPLLRRFLNPGHEDLHVVTFEIIQRIGPPAIPLLVDLLRHESGLHPAQRRR